MIEIPRRDILKAGGLFAALAGFSLSSLVRAREISATVKVIVPLTRKEGMTRHEFHDYWLNHHGPLVKEMAQDFRMQRYVQSHTVRDDLNEERRKDRKSQLVSYDGMSEVWWNSFDDFQQAFSDPINLEKAKRIAADEEKFIDWSRSAIWWSEERVIF